MIVLTALFLALQANGAPQGAPMTSLFRADDYPMEALRKGEQGSVFYALKIGKDGHPKACNITKSSGSTRLDETTCAILMKRARFRPARDQNGDPIEDVYKGHIDWHLQ